MKFKLLFHTGLALSIILPLAGFFALQNLQTNQTIDENRTVFINKSDDGFQLIRNGEPFSIQGAGGESHFKELAEIGGNTIRVFDTTNLLHKLDEAHKYNLAVIVDIYLPAYKSYYLYDDEKENDILKQQIIDLVQNHKDHPALLIWNLGNEINYPFVLRKNDFIKTFNELISIIHEIDPNHPVSTSIIGVGRLDISSIYIHSPELDLISFNTFGNTKLVNAHLSQISFLFGPRPHYYSELGPDGPWEASLTSWGAPIEATSSIKSELLRTRSNIIKENRSSASLGSLIFYWGAKLERTHTWFSLFKDGYKSENIKTIKNLWNPSHSSPTLIGLDYMLVNNKGSHDNIIFSPGEISYAEIIFKENFNETVSIDWEVYPEAWFSDTNEMVVNNYKPVNSFINFEKNRTTFIAPLNEGPYRIFAYIYDQDGFFASTNTPFYVLRNK